MQNQTFNNTETEQFFNKSSSEEIFEFVRSKLPEVDHDFIWYGKGLILLKKSMDAMVYFRDKHEMIINYENIINFVKLDNLKNIVNNDLPEDTKDGINHYILTIAPQHPEDKQKVHDFIFSGLFKIENSLKK